MRPLRHSRSFWFGLAGCLMIVGAWLHSLHWRCIGWCTPRDNSRVITVVHAGGWLAIDHFRPHKASSWNIGWRCSGSIGWEGDTPHVWFPPFKYFHTISPPIPVAEGEDPRYAFSGSTDHQVTLPHWLLLLLYSLLWCGAMIWIRCRRARAMQAITRTQHA